jgi:ribosomal-protein-alanine N-acetyltransferase
MIKEMLPGNFIIRPYRHGDFAGIKYLWEATNLSSPQRADDMAIIEESIIMGGALLILEDISSGTICGSSWMTFDGRRIHLHHFGILPEYQGKGYSKALLEHSLEIVKQKGYQVKLEVHKTNKRAVNLYKKYGFKSLGDYDIFIIRDVSKIE